MSKHPRAQRKTPARRQRQQRQSDRANERGAAGDGIRHGSYFIISIALLGFGISGTWLALDNSERRRSNDIMHELAHLFIEHVPATVIISPDGALALRTFDRKQEDEANWLSGCLLLPRPALVQIKQSGMGTEDACEVYGVSDELLHFRLNVTGVTVQMKRRRR